MIFRRIVEDNSVNSTTGRLKLARPTIDGVVGSVRSCFNIRLIIQGGANMALAPTNRLLLSHSRSVAHRVGGVIGRVDNVSSRTIIRISFNFPSLVNFAFVSKVVGGFGRIFPGTRISVCRTRLSSFLPTVHSNQLSFTVNALDTRVGLRSLRIRPLFRSRFILMTDGSQAYANAAALRSLGGRR